MIISYLFSLISGQMTFMQFAQSLIFSVLAVMVAMTVHEFSHSFTAFLLGDKTSRGQNRMSLNPINHIDVRGLVLLLLFGIGFAKPVNVNPSHFKHPRSGMMLTAAAGPLSNMITAFIFTFFWIITVIRSELDSSVFLGNLSTLLNIIIWYNITLGIFNLIPIPPLDGSKILGEMLPLNARIKYYDLQRYSVYIIIVLIIILNRVSLIEMIGNGIWMWFVQVLLPIVENIM